MGSRLFRRRNVKGEGGTRQGSCERHARLYPLHHAPPALAPLLTHPYCALPPGHRRLAPPSTTPTSPAALPLRMGQLSNCLRKYALETYPGADSLRKYALRQKIPVWPWRSISVLYTHTGLFRPIRNGEGFFHATP